MKITTVLALMLLLVSFVGLGRACEDCCHDEPDFPVDDTCHEDDYTYDMAGTSCHVQEKYCENGSSRKEQCDDGSEHER